MQLLRAADRPAIQWKNGGGVTRDIIVSPPGATMDDFDWRISIADVGSSGPFSSFPGIDRKLAVLEGKIALTIEGGAPIILDPHTVALDFQGESAVQADLVGGPSRDLNVMTRRGRFISRMVQQSAARPQITAPVAIIVALSALTVASAAGVIPMTMLDALLIEGPVQLTFAPKGASYYLIEISQPRL